MVDTVRERKEVQAMPKGSQLDRKKLSLVPGGIPGPREMGSGSKAQGTQGKVGNFRETQDSSLGA